MTLICGVREGIRMRARCAPARLGITTSTIAALALVAASSAVFAANLDKVCIFNIQAKTLESALVQFGVQAHVQISVAMDPTIRRLKAPQLNGHYTARQALVILLRGTRLSYVEHGQTVEVIVIGRKPPTHLSLSVNSEKTRNRGSPTDSDDPPAKRSSAATHAEQRRGELLQEVVVTGSRLRDASNEGPQEIQVYDEQAIDESGQDSVSGFLTTLPSVPVTSLSTAQGIAATASLRGLPVGTTLVLLDGRRLESSGLANYFGAAEYFDLNDIPLAAVQKIEIDENGSSAIYGSDAIAGVVNVILKQDFDGLSADAKYGWAKDLESVRTGLAFGKQWHLGGFSLYASYDRTGGMLNFDRRLTSDNNYSNYGGSNNDYPACSPGNIFSTTGAPLPGAPPGNQATYAAVTESKTGGASGFTYGALNECSLLAGLSILPSTQREGLLMQGHLDVGHAMQLFTEVLYTHIDQNQGTGYPVLFGTPGFQVYTASASNPYNPFGTQVGVAESLRDLPTTQFLNTDFFRPLIGLKGSFMHDWQWELSAWQSSDWTSDLVPNLVVNSGAIQSDLSSSDPAIALNPFTVGPIASPAVLQTLASAGNIKWMGRDRSVEGFARGSVLQLPAGAVQAVVGADYVRSTLYFNEINDGVDPPGSRFNFQQRYSAAFGEVMIPLIGAHAHGRDGSLLSVTIAGRHDQYNEIGGATTRQFGVKFKPLESLLFRATYGDAFAAPSLPELYLPELTGPALIVDPETGSPTLVRLVSGGNPKLRPLTGHSHTAGVVFAGDAVPGLALSITQWQVTEDNAIQSVAPQVIVDNGNLFSGRVIRDSNGAIVEVVDTELNFGSIDVAGMDYQLVYRRDIGLGKLAFDINATETYRYLQALVPGEAPSEAAGVAQDSGDWAPKWKGTVGVDWREGPVAAHLDGRYTNSYLDYDSTRQIGNFWICDANVRWDFEKVFAKQSDRSGGAYIEGGAINLFNRGPQFSDFGSGLYGYDLAEMSVIGRELYLQVGTAW